MIRVFLSFSRLETQKAKVRMSQRRRQIFQDGHMRRLFTALFNNMRTLKFKGQPTNAFFAAINQMFGGSSQLTPTAEHCFVL